MPTGRTAASPIGRLEQVDGCGTVRAGPTYWLLKHSAVVICPSGCSWSPGTQPCTTPRRNKTRPKPARLCDPECQSMPVIVTASQLCTEEGRGALRVGHPPPTTRPKPNSLALSRRQRQSDISPRDAGRRAIAKPGAENCQQHCEGGGALASGIYI